MRATEFISEAFNSKVPYEVVWARRDLFRTMATIGNRVIVFDASDDADTNEWIINFGEQRTTNTGKNNFTFKKTGSGNELQVFGFVIESIKEFVARYHPMEIVFTSNKADQNRTNLYKSLAQRFQLPGYKLVDIADVDDEDKFIFRSDKYEAPIRETNNGTRWTGNELYREIGDEGFNEDVNNSNQITLAQLYNGHYPDRDEEFWDHVSSSDMNIPLPVHQIAPYKLSIMLLSQYRIEHLDDLFDMMNEEQQETVQHYINDPNLSAQTIVIEDGRIIDGNHRALAAAIKKKPINAVDLMDLENQEVDEGVADWAKKGAVAGAMALGALGSGQADAKPIKPVQKPAIVQPAKQQTAPAKQQASTKSAPAQYNLLSNNPENEITLQKAARQAGMKGAELAQFMAQMKHESWDFDRMKEKAQPGVKDYYAKKYDMKYSPRTAKILGNKHAGDGARYHGRGFVQLTGRDNYRMASDAIGIDLLNHPDLASRPDVAAKVALWYWNTRVKPNVRNFADTATVTKYINPAARGLESRDSNFKDYMRII